MIACPLIMVLIKVEEIQARDGLVAWGTGSFRNSLLSQGVLETEQTKFIASAVRVSFRLPRIDRI